MRNVIKHKSDCKFCEEAIVLSNDGKKVIAHYKCAIDNEDMSYGCKPGLCADCNHVGNAAKMREALEICASMGEQIDNQLGSSEDTVYAFRGERCLAHNISECARAALSAPPRNCDIGTAEEQHARFYSFCDKFEECKKCPLWRGGGLTSKCYSRWSQMPYEEGCEK